MFSGKANIRFFAGCPVAMPDGTRLGTLCVMDRVPRRFDAHGALLLKDLAELAERELTTERAEGEDPLTGLAAPEVDGLHLEGHRGSRPGTGC